MTASVQHRHPPCIEFWFDFGSNYSYLSAMRIEELAGAAGVSVAWKPFLLGVIYRELGWKEPPFVTQVEKGRYAWRDTQRQARKYGIAFKLPSVFPRIALLPSRVAILGAQQPWQAAFCKNVMQQNWVLDQDINEAEQVLAALAGLVEDPARTLEQAQSDANKLKLREQTQLAREKGVFGAPTFFAGDEMFWGDDRLEDALRWFATPPAT